MKLLSMCLSAAILLCATVLDALECDRFYCSGTAQAGNVSVLINSSQDGRFWYVNTQNLLDSDTTFVYLDQPGWRDNFLRSPQHPYAGFKAGGAAPLTVPIFFPDAGGTPNHSRFIPLETDPQGDEAFSLPNLDILSSRVAFSETRLFYSLKCNTNSYPVNNGFTFYSYMGVLIDPDADPGSDPIVFALMNTVTAPGVISPGLYKITGNGTSDLLLIGPVEITEDTNAGVLTLSCALSDLLADADFSTWFDPTYPRVATQAMTSRITLSGGNVVADNTLGTDILLQPKQINFTNAHAPVLSNFQATWSQGQLSVQVTYSDPDHNFAEYPHFGFDNAGPPDYMLYPVDLIGFDQPVIFAGGPVPCPENWQEVNFTFMNGSTSYGYTFPNPNLPASEDLLVPEILRAWPNPASDRLQVEKAGTEPLRIYNLRGQLMLQATLAGKSGSLDVSSFPAGVYILRQGQQQKRWLKL